MTPPVLYFSRCVEMLIPNEQKRGIKTVEMNLNY